MVCPRIFVNNGQIKLSDQIIELLRLNQKIEVIKVFREDTNMGLAEAKTLQSWGLKKRYPVNTKLIVLYNPDVTLILFQKRSLNIILYVSEIAEKELET
ncbi:MAG: hypothetical protein HN764_14150 [Gammaproteobacteria bacterium]|nr:hypothetical protein [Gammaproteobacteria bacterium]